jgi:outer membrane protein assembly factor BamB
MTATKLAQGPFRATLAIMLAGSLSACGIIGGGDGPKTTPTVGNRIPVLSKIETGAKVDPSLQSVSVILPPAQPNSEWAQAGGNAGKANGHLALADSPNEVWSAQIAGSTNRRRLAAAPVIGGGMLFAVDTDGVVHAFDAQSGGKRWTYRMKIADNQSASYFGGRVYATNGVGEVVALNAETGEEVWTVQPAGPLRGSPTIAFNSVFVMTQDNQIHALSTVDGKQQWQESGSTAQAGVFGVAAPAAGQGSVVAGYSWR